MFLESATTALSFPTVIWSGILASVITLAGVILSNRSSLERLREQLRHDAREKHRDRVSELRKVVYLELTTQMMRANGHLGSLAGKDPTSGDFGEPLQSAISELAKAQLIGTRETSAIAGELATTYGEVLMRLIMAAKPLHETKTDIKIASEMYDQQYAQAMRVLGEITSENESGTPDPTRMAALNLSFDRYRAHYTKYSEERNAAWDSYNAQQRGFATTVLEEIKRIAPLTSRLTLAIRSEIGLDTDFSELKRRLDESQVRATAAIDELLEKLSPHAE